MDATRLHNHTHGNHHGSHYFRKNKHVFWTLVTLFSVLPALLILLKLYRKVSEYQESRRQSGNPRDTSRLSNEGIYTITIKQDYGNLAPPRYSDLTKYPVLGTYEKPPPYSTTPIR